MREQDVGLYRFDDMRNLVAVLSLVSGILHFVATFEYVGVWAGYAIFFMLVALAQAAYGLAMFFQPWASDRRVQSGAGERLFLQLGAIATGAIVLLWFFAHLVTTPIGPQAGERQPITLLSVAAVVAMAAQTWYLVRLIRVQDRDGHMQPIGHEQLSAGDE